MHCLLDTGNQAVAVSRHICSSLFSLLSRPVPATDISTNTGTFRPCADPSTLARTLCPTNAGTIHIDPGADTDPYSRSVRKLSAQVPASQVSQRAHGIREWSLALVRTAS